MKIGTKLTIFFSVILFILVLALSSWYQYRLFHFLRQETIKNIDRFSNNILRSSPRKHEHFRMRNDLNNDFKLRLNEIKNRDNFSKILNKYTWFALYDKNLYPIEETSFAREFPLKNINSLINKKYFTIKLKINSKYFRSDNIEFLPEYRLVMEHGFYTDTDKNDYTFYCIGKTTVLNTGNEKSYFIVLLPENKNIEYLNKSLMNVIFSLLFLICIIIFLGLLYSKYSLNPINKIINDLNNISEKNLSERIKLNSNNKDEISEISLSINNLLNRIENAFNMEKQFISDISHEFKTPISILQLNMDNISNNPNLTDEEVDKITSSLEILYSLDFLIQKLLYLSRLESNLCPFNPDTISLKDLLNSIINNLQSIAELKKLKFMLSMEEDNLMINGDRELLYIAFYNIIENALKYTHKGYVLIKTEKNNNKVRVIIEDTGIGIPKEKTCKIFDKFYRVDSARIDSKSFGIGLTIAKRILDIHNATIDIESIENVNTKFIIDF